LFSRKWFHSCTNFSTKPWVKKRWYLYYWKMKNCEIVDWLELFFYINTAKTKIKYKNWAEFVNEWKRDCKVRVEIEKDQREYYVRELSCNGAHCAKVVKLENCKWQYSLCRDFFNKMARYEQEGSGSVLYPDRVDNPYPMDHEYIN